MPLRAAPLLLLQAIVQQNPQPLLEAAAEEHAAWLAAALARPAAAPDALADFVLGSTAGGLPLSPSFYGCMHQHCPVRWACWAGAGRWGWLWRQVLHASSCIHHPPIPPSSRLPACPPAAPPGPSQSVTFDQLRGAVQRARMSTRTRVAMLEQEVRGRLLGGHRSLCCYFSCPLATAASAAPSPAQTSTLSPALSPAPDPPTHPQVKALRCEAGDLRDIVRGYREVEARVRWWCGRGLSRGVLAEGGEAGRVCSVVRCLQQPGDP